MELANRKKTKLGIILYSNDPFEISLKQTFLTLLYSYCTVQSCKENGTTCCDHLFVFLVVAHQLVHILTHVPLRLLVYSAETKHLAVVLHIQWNFFSKKYKRVKLSSVGHLRGHSGGHLKGHSGGHLRGRVGHSVLFRSVRYVLLTHQCLTIFFRILV